MARLMNAERLQPFKSIDNVTAGSVLGGQHKYLIKANIEQIRISMRAGLEHTHIYSKEGAVFILNEQLIS